MGLDLSVPVSVWSKGGQEKMECKYAKSRILGEYVEMRRGFSLKMEQQFSKEFSFYLQTDHLRPNIYPHYLLATSETKEFDTLYLKIIRQ